MQTAQIVASVAAVIVATASFVVAQYTSIRTRRAEGIRNLLQEDSDVAFAALKLLRDGLPPKDSQRQLVIAALMQACVFEGSDRARALLYRVVELHRDDHGAEFRRAYEQMDATFESMEKYGFTKEELNLDRGRRRSDTVAKVLNRPPEERGEALAPPAS